MEIGLNLIWALLAAMALWLWLGRARASRHCGMLRGTLLLMCVLLLLFPCISVSDDLYGGAMIEDSAVGGRKLRAHASALQHILVALLPSPIPLVPSLISSFHRIEPLGLSVADVVLEPSAPRSPPSSFLS